MIEMSVHRVGLRAKDGDPIVVLREENGERCLTLKVTTPQANAVMRHAHRMPPFRPQTHELVLATIAALGCRVGGARIGLSGSGELVGKISILRQHGEVELPADPIDAIILALRSAAPILVAPDVLARYATVGHGDCKERRPNVPAPSPALASKDPFHEFITGLASVDELGP